VEERTVANDYTVSWLGQHYQIPLEQARPRLRKARIRIAQQLDARVIGRFENYELHLQLCQREKALLAEPVKSKIATPKRSKPNREWMKHFVVGDPNTWAERRAQGPPAGSP
jgi:hypothetical protein